MSHFGIVTSKYRRQGSGRPTLIDGLPVVQSKGKHWYVDGTKGASGGGDSYNAAFMLPSEAVAKASAYDFIHVAPNNGAAYVESAVLNVSVRGLTIIGEGPIASVWVQPTTVGVSGIIVSANEVTFQNFGGEGEATAKFGLEVQDAVEEFRAYYSKFGGSGGVPGNANDIDAVRLTGAGPCLFDTCEFAWAGQGVKFRGGLTSFPTQVKIINSLFHNLAASHITAYNNDLSQIHKVVDLWHVNNIHSNLELGTEPTKEFIRVNRILSSGLIAGNQFATATNSNTKFKLHGDGLMKWGANATEAGWSTARPA